MMGYLSEGREMKLKRHLRNRSAMQNWVEAKICSAKELRHTQGLNFQKSQRVNWGNIVLTPLFIYNILH